MCGIVGIWDKSGLIHNIEEHIDRMTATLSHRGPDDSGTWINRNAGIAVGHKRLSVIDLSPAGHQPMESSCGRYVITFNGEIYNFRLIKKELVDAGRNFRSYSDTEVVLEAISQWGLEPALEKFIGMFAFGLWDKEHRHLYLARDRVGKKPLYVYHKDSLLLFGSELKALCACSLFAKNIDTEALTSYVRYLYVPAPKSIFHDTIKLLPGHYMSISRSGYPLQHCYWDASGLGEPVSPKLKNISDSSAVETLESLLSDAVSLRMIADVPLGAFLSGGIDSSTIVAIMQNQSRVPVKTFTIGFREAGYNEAESAWSVAKFLGTDHTELYVVPEDALSVIPQMPELYDEPFGDSSAIPTFLISKLARGHVTIALSGDGGDELFAGYTRYAWDRGILGYLRNMPFFLKYISASTLDALPPPMIDKAANSLRNILPKKMRHSLLGDKMHKLAALMRAENPDELYRYLVSPWRNPLDIVINGSESHDRLNTLQNETPHNNSLQRMMLWDLLTYLPDDILTKVDRASMGVSLEVRNPFLDHRVIEFAWRLPERMKIRGGQTKWLIRQILYKYIPKRIVSRPKMGFGLPIDNWLKGPLREWAESLLNEKRLQKDGYFHVAPIRNCWEEHVHGRRNWQYKLWGILMFQAWKEKWLK